MNKPKIIGLVTAWGAEMWIESALRQAVGYCDEIIVGVWCWHECLKRFEDKTYEICEKYGGKINLVDVENLTWRAVGLNQMLRSSEMFEIGNWVWLLDADEAYPESSYKEIKNVISEDEYNYIIVEEKFFLINMWHYLKGSHHRLYRIDSQRNRYNPKSQNHWNNKKLKKYTLKRENGLFHYSMLTNTKIHGLKWIEEGNKYRYNWLNEIYYKYDLKNEGYWINQNKKKYKHKSPWFKGDFQPDKNGRLFRYKGKHPRFIEESGLTKIKDFRKLYD